VRNISPPSNSAIYSAKNERGRKTSRDETKNMNTRHLLSNATTNFKSNMLAGTNTTSGDKLHRGVSLSMLKGLITSNETRNQMVQN